MEPISASFIGSIVGILTRLLPEIIKIINKIIDNKHEMKMLEKSSQISENISQSKLDMQFSEPDYELIDRIINVQNTSSGSKNIDKIRMLVRPSTTYIILGLYVVVKLAWFYMNPTAALLVIWSPTDMGILSGIFSFWFLGRVFDKK